MKHEQKMSNIDSNLVEGMTRYMQDEGDKYKVTTKTCYTTKRCCNYRK